MLTTRAITRDEYVSSSRAPLSVIDDRHDSYATAHADAAATPQSACGLYFMEEVRRQVMQQFGTDEVLKGGLRIYTTIDMQLQRAAEDAILARLGQLDKKGELEGALVALDPRSGEVLALVGGRDFHQSPFDRAIQARRQPGSAFKPLFFAAAIEQGYSPSSLITDLDSPIDTPQGAWLPAGEHEADSYTLRQALTVSSNRAAVRVMQLVGIGVTQSYAQRLGISSPMPPVPSLALGTGEMSLLDLTSAYGAFANDGVIAPHTLISRVEDREGRLLWSALNAQHSHRAVRPGTAYLMSSMMADVMNRGTGSRARSEGFKLPAAGKTGTTDDYADAWFVGYTPHLVTGVWFGFDEKRKIMNRGFAGTVAVPAWARFMIKATEGAKPEWFKPTSDVVRVTTCRLTGLQAGEACRVAVNEDGRPNIVDDFYLRGTEPYETCSGHHTAPSAVVGGAGETPREGDPTRAPSAVF